MLGLLFYWPAPALRAVIMIGAWPKWLAAWREGYYVGSSTCSRSGWPLLFIIFLGCGLPACSSSCMLDNLLNVCGVVPPRQRVALMEEFEIALVSVAAMLTLIYLGLHIATTLALISFIGVWLIKGNATVAMNLLWVSAYDSVNNYVFAAIPTFVLMGFLVRPQAGRDA
jgi:hypothetical protein